MGAGARWALYTPHPRSPSPSGSGSSSSVGCSRTYPKIKSDSSRKSTCPKLPTGNKSPEPNIFFQKKLFILFFCVCGDFWESRTNKMVSNDRKIMRSKVDGPKFTNWPGCEVRKSLGGIVSLSSSRMWVSKALLQLAVRRREVPGSSSFF